MACIAGTIRDPRVWYTRDGERRVGRWCMRLSDATSVRTRNGPLRPGQTARSCSGCPCYRGIERDGSLVDGLTGVDDPVMFAYTEKEWNLLLDEGYEALIAYKDRLAAVSTIARTPGMVELLLEDEEVEEVREYVRDGVRRWRARNPGADKRKRDRAAYFREYRKRKAQPVMTVGALGDSRE